MRILTEEGVPVKQIKAPPQDPEYRCGCMWCQCAFAVRQSECAFAHEYNGDIYYRVGCPACNKDVFFTSYRVFSSLNVVDPEKAK